MWKKGNKKTATTKTLFLSTFMFETQGIVHHCSKENVQRSVTDRPIERLKTKKQDVIYMKQVT